MAESSVAPANRKQQAKEVSGLLFGNVEMIFIFFFLKNEVRFFFIVDHQCWNVNSPLSVKPRGELVIAEDKDLLPLSKWERSTSA